MLVLLVTLVALSSSLLRIYFGLKGQRGLLRAPPLLWNSHSQHELPGEQRDSATLKAATACGVTAWETEMAYSLCGSPSRENSKYMTISEVPHLLLSRAFFLDRKTLLSSFHYLFLVQLFLLQDTCLHRLTFPPGNGKNQEELHGWPSRPGTSECLIHYFRCLFLQTQPDGHHSESKRQHLFETCNFHPQRT